MKLPAAILATSAFAITAFAIVEAGSLQPAAHAGGASVGIGGTTMVTASSGKGPDADPYETLFVIDNRSEMLMVYSVSAPPEQRLVLLGGSSLPALFRAARGG